MRLPLTNFFATQYRRDSERRRAWLTLLVLTGFALASLLAACLVGSVSLTIYELPAAIKALTTGAQHDLASTLLVLRATRASTAFVTGAELALAGVIMQTLLRNPLADPYVLGVSGGAAVGALAAMLAGAALWLVDISAFWGAIAVSAVLFSLARRDFESLHGNDNGSKLLLTGVILGTGCSALIMLLLSVSSEGQLRGMVFWMIGDLSGARSRWLSWLSLGLALVFAIRFARSMNLLAQYGENAVTLGVDVGLLKKGMFVAAALLTAGAVSVAGSIGFVGLIVPHACRYAFGFDHRLLLPASVLAGGSFLVIADTLARTIVAPQQLPVGVVTALIGVPVFLIQMHYRGRA